MADDNNDDALEEMAKNEEEELTAKNEEFLRKWSGWALLGPFLPAVFAVCNIVFGMLAVNNTTGNLVTGAPALKKVDCNDVNLDLYLQIIVVLSYIHLFIYSWVFLGDYITVNVPIIDKEITILGPFRSLRFLMFYYFIEGVVSFIVMSVATYFHSITLSINSCATKAPALYNYMTFAITIYWTGFTIIMAILVQMKFGQLILDQLNNFMRDPTEEELQEKIFRKKFSDFDKDKLGYIVAEDLPSILIELGVHVPDEELPDLINSLDPKQEGNVTFDALLSWFRKMNSVSDDEPAVMTEGAALESGKDK